MTVFGLAPAGPSFFDFLSPVAVFEREPPVVTAERQEQALDALLPVEDHMVLCGRVHLGDLCAVRVSRAVDDRPERAKRNTLQLLMVHLPKEQRPEGPTTNQGVDEERNLIRSPHVRALQIRNEHGRPTRCARSIKEFM